MKSIKIKVKPKDPIHFNNRYATIQEELTWLWNEVRNIALRNHAFTWYEWAEKRGPEIFGKFSLDGCIRCALNFDKSSAWMGASCPISTGGSYWVDNPRKPPIPYRAKSGEIKKKPAQTLRSTGERYRRIQPREHRYVSVNGVTLDKISKFDSKKLLTKLRADVGLPAMTAASDLIGGLLAQFEESWKAFLNVNQVFGKKPRYRKDGSQVSTFYNNQKGPKFQNGVFLIVDKIELIPIDKNWKKRLYSTNETIMRSYQLTKEPSGWYLCISLASPEESLKPTLKRRIGQVKKRFGEHSVAYLDAKQRVDSLLQSLEPTPIENFEVTADIEVLTETALLKLDGGQLFEHNKSRQRVEHHVNELKSRLSKIRATNDRKLSLEAGSEVVWYQRKPTKNEAKLAQRIKRLYERSRSSRAHFNHKLSTRLSRTYDAINWIENSGVSDPENRLDGIAGLRSNLELKMNRQGKKFIVTKAEKE